MSELKIGQSASVTKTFTAGDVLVFAGFTGDMNPVHVNEEFAKTTKFGRRIVHGPYVATLIGSVLGQQLPGGGSVYVSQDIHFRAPVFVDDTITCTLTVTAMDVERNRLTLDINLVNQDGKLVMDGTSVTMPALKK
ncbi:MAG: MaoC family dehydratase [Lachnospiraceae bacterium]|nr:MaoC family dehydratase [Lachnospiraceae bacterium]